LDQARHSLRQENGHENKLDVIYPHAATATVPAVIYIHGGGWVCGDKAGGGIANPSLRADGMGGGKRKVSNGERLESIGGGRRLTLRAALGGSQCEGISD
jgi:hypothetical protein